MMVALIKNTAWRRNKFTFIKEEIWHKQPATKELTDCSSQRYHWGRSIGLCCWQEEHSAAATLSAAFATAGQFLSLMHSHHPCHQRSWFHWPDLGWEWKASIRRPHIGPLCHVPLWWCHLSERVHIENKCFHFKTCFGVIFDSVRDRSVYISLPQISSSPNSCCAPSMRSCQTPAIWFSCGHAHIVECSQTSDFFLLQQRPQVGVFPRLSFLGESSSGWVCWVVPEGARVLQLPALCLYHTEHLPRRRDSSSVS